MNGFELLQTLINLYNEVVMDGVKSDSWTTKLSNLHLTDKELVIDESEAIKQQFLEWVAMKQDSMVNVPSVGYIKESALLMAMHNDTKYHNPNAETALEELAKRELMVLTKTSKFNTLKTAFDGLCKVCFDTESKVDRFNALLTLYIAVKDWSQDSGLIDTDIRQKCGLTGAK